MSFSFSFSGDDIEKQDDDEDSNELAKQIEDYQITDKPIIQTKVYALKDLISDLPSQISYNNLEIPAATTRKETLQNTSKLSSDEPIVVQRRAIFDIRAQLMTEANPEINENDDLLSGLEHGDLTKGVYEGGFKTWECAIDLASLVTSLDLRHDWHIIELGAGTAVPSLTILKNTFRQKNSNNSTTNQGHLHFTLCDFNEDVLRLATAPNVLLNFLIHERDLGRNGNTDEELDLEDFDEDILVKLEDKRISFKFVSGEWSNTFLDYISPPPILKTKKSNEDSRKYQILILASETIYSPESTKIFAEILISLLQRDRFNTKAWVAAKKVYFGVGGGIEDFSKEIESRKGKIRLLHEASTIGVGRVVLEITVE